MPGVLHPGAEDLARQAVVRVDEEQQLRGLQRAPDGVQGRVVEAGAEARGADDDASAVPLFAQAGELVVDGWYGGGEGEGCEEGDAAVAGGGEVFEFGVDCGGPGWGVGGGEEVEPGVGEGEDGVRDGVAGHEGEDAGEGGVGGGEGAAEQVGRGVWVGAWGVGGEDDEAGMGGWVARGGWGVVEEGWGGAGREEGEVGGRVDVGMGVD